MSEHLCLSRRYLLAYSNRATSQTVASSPAFVIALTSTALGALYVAISFSERPKSANHINAVATSKLVLVWCLFPQTHQAHSEKHHVLLNLETLPIDLFQRGVTPGWTLYGRPVHSLSWQHRCSPSSEYQHRLPREYDDGYAERIQYGNREGNHT